MENEVARHVADTLKALAHPARLKIVEFLVDGEKCVGEIMEAVGEKQAITSQQLNMMKDKGVLACRREGSKVFYRIENENVIRLLDCVYDHCDKQKGEKHKK